MSFVTLSKGSALSIKAKDPLAINLTVTPPATTQTFLYNGVSTALPGQSYNLSTSTTNGLVYATKDTLAFRRVSEHNRSEFNIGSNRIEQQTRMANGSMRKYFIADKATFSLSWTMLPSFRNETVDGAWGAEDIKAFYESAAGQGQFDIRVKSSSEVDYSVIFTSCNFVLAKRGIQSYWNVDISMEQV